LTEAHGRNVVNVVVVDFRGFDTLGEITVLLVAALGIVSLVQAGRRRGRNGDDDGDGPGGDPDGGGDDVELVEAGTAPETGVTS